jgi:hypothetical protein
VELFSLEGKSVYKKSDLLDIGATTVKQVLTLNRELQGRSGIYFLVLNLTDAAGQAVSHNVYWLSRDHDFNSLKRMPAARVQARLIKTETTSPHENRRTYEFSNPSGQLAFFINPQLWNEGEEIMPSFWSANYFSLAPGEKIIVTVSCPDALSGNKPTLKMDGWNVNGL